MIVYNVTIKIDLDVHDLWLKWMKEEHMARVLKPGTLVGLPLSKRRKVGTTSSHHGPYAWGYTRATMVGTEGSRAAK